MNPAEYLGHSFLDLGRQARIGIPEAVYAPGKSVEQLLRIAGRFLEARSNLLITKCDAEKMAALRRAHPALHASACAGLAWKLFERPKGGRKRIGFLSAGTSDLPVLLEAALTAAFLGHRVKVYSDCGVAGLHRTVKRLGQLADCGVLVVVAGMEGALPTVVSALTGKPIIAVPTSTGYGATQGGLTTLHAMAGSCSPTVSVVNIDNGFGAGCVASAINREIG